MNGKTVLVTGATDGLGRALARELTAAGATVLVHGRDPDRIAATAAEIGSDHVRTYSADLSSLSQVARMAGAIAESEPRLDALVNNAGIGTTVSGGERRQESEDGIELRFAVNYLAGYLLAERLRELLVASAPARIVNVSSAGQMPLDFDDLMLERGYSGVRAYCQSKLAQILYTFDVAGRLRGSGVSATCLHPATYMPTKMVPGAAASTLEEGVSATMRLVADPALEDVTGKYFDGERESSPDPQASDPEARRRLREASERLTGGR